MLSAVQKKRPTDAVNKNLMSSPSKEIFVAALLANRDLRSSIGKNLDTFLALADEMRLKGLSRTDEPQETEFHPQVDRNSKRIFDPPTLVQPQNEVNETNIVSKLSINQSYEVIRKLNESK